jgi:hypothetical protein
VAALEGGQDSNWLNERRQEEVKALVRDVLADADTRASLAGEGMTAGHNGKHFFLASEDGSFSMAISGQIQFRYIWNNRDDDPGDPDNDVFTSPIDENEAGFTIPRTKLKFDGHVADPRIVYHVVLAANRNNNSVGLEDVTAGYKIADNLLIEGGRQKLPFLREELISSSKQLAVERSSVNEFFTLNRGEGIWVTWHAMENLKVTGAISDGDNSGNIGGGINGGNDFQNDRTDSPAITARIDWALAGNLSQADDFTAWEGDPTSIVIGAAVHYEHGEVGDNVITGLVLDDDGIPEAGVGYEVNSADIFSWTVDASLEMFPLNVYGAIVGRHIMDVTVTNIDEDLVSDIDSDQYGAVVQVGFHVIPNKLEPYFRFEWIDTDSPDSSTDDEVIILTFGANYFLNRHNAKFTMDLVWALDPLHLGNTIGGANGNSSGLGLLPDNGNEEDQLALRAQFQLLF